jgi:hypothetical protein
MCMRLIPASLKHARVDRRWHHWSTMLQLTPINHIKRLSVPAINQFSFVAESAVVYFHIAIQDVDEEVQATKPLVPPPFSP